MMKMNAKCQAGKLMTIAFAMFFAFSTAHAGDEWNGGK